MYLQADWIFKKLKDELKLDDSSTKALHGIICVAGGWTGGNIISQEFLKSVDQMWKQSVESSAVAAFLAGKLLKQDGLLVLTGAQAALNPTPSMIGYGMAKVVFRIRIIYATKASCVTSVIYGIGGCASLNKKFGLRRKWTFEECCCCRIASTYVGHTQ